MSASDRLTLVDLTEYDYTRELGLGILRDCGRVEKDAYQDQSPTTSTTTG